MVSRKNETNNGISKTYIVTLDMSKEICMLDKSERGSIARKYFIEQDNKQLALEATQPQIDTNALAMTISTAVVQAMMSIQPINQHASSKSIYPIQPKFYSDRFGELIDLVRHHDELED
jgi:uncharacterized glyoxalase superfamily protein PhnB